MEKVVRFEKTADICLKRAEEKINNGEKEEALGLLFSALDMEPYNADILKDIASVYSQLNLKEISNEYWFRFLEVAPSLRDSEGYKEIIRNFYAMDNYVAMSFYIRKLFNKNKLEIAEEPDEDFLETIKSLATPREAYFIAYPYSRADYSYKLDNAKKAVSSFNFDIAITLFDEIPKQFYSLEDYGDLAYSFYMVKKDEKAIETCKESLLKFGDNSVAFCLLSSIYKEKKNSDKSLYYYEKALDCKSNGVIDDVRLVNCAMDQGDNLTVKKLLEKILQDKDCKLFMRFYYVICLINLGDMKGAKEQIHICRLLNPKDKMFEYYSKLIDGIIEDKDDAVLSLPLKYEKKIPEYIETKNKKIIKKIADGNFELLNKKENKDILRWGLFSDNLQTAKKCTIILTTISFSQLNFSTIKCTEVKNIFKEALMSNSVLLEIKKLIVYNLIAEGSKERFGVLNGDFYIKVKPRKLLCEGEKGDKTYLFAYSLCVVKTVFFGIEDIDKIAFSINTLYSKYRTEIEKSGYSVEQISAIALAISEIDILSDIEQVCVIFNVEKEKIEPLISLIKGEKQ
ncbi:MAG: hypothetical protein MJ066_03695 [Clostridia bacterium]|nr:hypothetical protein [Clostridia bacterium]